MTIECNKVNLNSAKARLKASWPKIFALLPFEICIEEKND